MTLKLAAIVGLSCCLVREHDRSFFQLDLAVTCLFPVLWNLAFALRTHETNEAIFFLFFLD